jgi:hypothetical protein
VSRNRARAGRLVAALLLLAAFASQYALVRPRNFAGFDEWLLLWLSHHGIVGSPYSNRPLNFLWTLPGALVPNSFLGFHLLHGLYLGLSGVVAFLVAACAFPGRQREAVLVGLATACWAPWDRARLSSVQMTINSGSACAALVAVLLLLLAWQRRSRLVLVIACALALAVARSYEGVLGVLVVAPLVPIAVGPRDRRLWAFVTPWLATVALASALCLAPILTGAPGASYQARTLGVELGPRLVLGRLLARFAEHLGPLLTTIPAAADGPAPWLAAAFAAAALAAAAGLRQPEPPPGAGAVRQELEIGALGLAFAAGGYGPFLVSASLDGPHRAETQAAFGIGLLLSALFALGARAFGPRRRGVALAVAAAWLAAAGATRTAALQRDWDRDPTATLQFRSLSGLLKVAPRLLPHTLVVAIDDSGAWRSSFGFRQALLWIYDGEAAGVLVDRPDQLYRTTATPLGLRTEPLGAIRSAWGVVPDLNRYAELVVVRFDRSGGAALLERWPAWLSPYEVGARYSPRRRIRAGPPAPGAAILAP